MSAPTATSLRQHYVHVLRLGPACTTEEIAARLAASTPEELLELDRRLQDAGVDAFLAESESHPGIADLDDEPMQFDEARGGRGAPYLRQMLRRAGVPEDRWIRHDNDGSDSTHTAHADAGPAESVNDEQATCQFSTSRALLLRMLVASLPDIEREVVSLVAFEGLSHAQASKILSVSTTQVSSAFQAAVTRLQRSLLEAQNVTTTRVPEVLQHALKLS